MELRYAAHGYADGRGEFTEEEMRFLAYSSYAENACVLSEQVIEMRGL